jgi:hypothetical protein
MGSPTKAASITRTRLRESSVAGLSHAVRAKHGWARAYWLVVFVVGMYYTVSSVVSLMQDYLTYPVVTAIDVTIRPALPFPSVTICNLNR